MSNAAVPVAFRLQCLHKNQHEAVDRISTVSFTESFDVTMVKLLTFNLVNWSVNWLANWSVNGLVNRSMNWLRTGQ